ncbi:hypothetical protein RUM44_007181 [Polyplax serrata]|uniref:Mitochondrial assembly of ribosomal large subunit protein 1 n=1 Tax=Polyplax serrata TaxID=468196 RepID=A0ABR1B024_POLSC
MFRNAAQQLRILQRNTIKSNKLLIKKDARLLTTTPIRWKTKDPDLKETLRVEVPNTISSKYEPFSEETAPIILDIEEERRKVGDEAIEDVVYDEFAGINMKRGLTGVYDIEDLVELLRRENAVDMFVARIPKEFQYADYIIVVTGKSNRHMVAMAEFVRKVFKRKMSKGDIIPKIEGKYSKDWIALDLSNIVLHIMSASAREYYDIETLWAVGKEFDTLSQQKTQLDGLLKDYSKMLAELTPDITEKEETN